jgi:hypothetical protein
VADLLAGWQPDPTGRHSHRYWDGTRWTDHVADAGVPALDPFEPPSGPGEPGEPELSTVLTWRPPAPVRRVPEPVRAAVPEPEPEPEPEAEVPAVSRLSGWLAEPSPIPPPAPRPPARPAGAPALDPEESYRRGWILMGVGAVILVVAAVILLGRGDGDDDPDAGSTGAGRSPGTSVDLATPTSSDGAVVLPDGPSDELTEIPGLSSEELESGLGLTEQEARCFSQQLAGAASRGEDTADPSLLVRLLDRCGADISALGSP